MYENSNIENHTVGEDINLDKVDNVESFVLENTKMNSKLEQKVKNDGLQSLNPLMIQRKIEEIPSNIIRENMVLDVSKAKDKNPWFNND